MTSLSSFGINVPLALIKAVASGKFGAVKAALEAGANVNGHPEGPVPPIVIATTGNHAGIVKFLLARGADPDKPVLMDVPESSADDTTTFFAGERALHIAAKSGNVEIVRLLLKRARADPDTTDNTGRTPLMATCQGSQVCVEVVRLLLEAGADPALADEDGWIPLHMVARKGHMDLVDMLYSGAPATLNRYDAKGQTPLCLACGAGHESMVSRLLSLGAMQRMPLDERGGCPIAMAAGGGCVGVVRVLMNEGGIRAVGGEEALSKALPIAVCFRQAKILRLLLTVHGEERRSEWANIMSLDGWHLLHHGAGLCYPAAVSVLLEAGADEAARDSKGRIPRDVIGISPAVDFKPVMDAEKKEVAIRRMLERGPAYRARSWAWPSDEEEADAGGSGDGDTAVAAAAAVLSSPPAVKTPPVVGVRIFRPKEKNNNELFVRLVGRYCAKD